jgi:hypothetical protein
MIAVHVFRLLYLIIVRALGRLEGLDGAAVMIESIAGLADRLLGCGGG